MQAKVTDAQAQAADIGIKALEVMVATQEQGTGGVSLEDIGASLAAHMEVASQANGAVKVLAVAGASSTAAALASPNPTMPVVVLGATSTTVLQLVKDAETSIATAQQLAGEQKLGEAVGYLKDATQKSYTAQKQVAQEALALSVASSSTASAEPPAPTMSSSTSPSSSTPAVPPASPSGTASSTKP